SSHPRKVYCIGAQAFSGVSCLLGTYIAKPAEHCPGKLGARAVPQARAPKLTFVFAEPNNRNYLHKGSFCFLTTPDEVVTIQVHDLPPCGRKVFHELLLRSRAGIDLGERTQLRVRTKDQVDACSGPLERVRLAVAALVETLFTTSRLPLRAHVQQVDEEVVRQNSGPPGENAV